jgi:hypothetical protein
VGHWLDYDYDYEHEHEHDKTSKNYCKVDGPWARTGALDKMSETATPPAGNYCYQCGRRVNKQVDHCWYCGAATHRWVRPPKRCPFCGEVVRGEAIKCRHCGEFMDGRPSPVTGPSQVVYIVDKDLLRAARDYRLLAGQPVPPEVARALDAQTVRAIENNQPRLITTPGVHALPTPSAGDGEHDIVDVEPIAPQGPSRQIAPHEHPRQIEGRRELVVSRGEAREEASNLPARRGDAPPLPAVINTGLALGRALGRAGGWLIRKAVGPEGDENTIDVEAKDQYRICDSCQTEILASDNYCFHCGMQHNKTVYDERREAKARRRGIKTILPFMAIAALLIGYGVVKVGLLLWPPYVGQLMGVAAGVLCLTVVIFTRGVVTKFFALVLLAILYALYSYL